MHSKLVTAKSVEHMQQLDYFIARLIVVSLLRIHAVGIVARRSSLLVECKSYPMVSGDLRDVLPVLTGILRYDL